MLRGETTSMTAPTPSKDRERVPGLRWIRGRGRGILSIRDRDVARGAVQPIRQRIAVAGGSVIAVWDGTSGQSSPGGDPERQRGALARRFRGLVRRRGGYNALLWERRSRQTLPVRRRCMLLPPASAPAVLSGWCMLAWHESASWIWELFQARTDRCGSQLSSSLASLMTSQQHCSPHRSGNHPSIGDFCAPCFIRLSRGA